MRFARPNQHNTYRDTPWWYAAKDRAGVVPMLPPQPNETNPAIAGQRLAAAVRNCDLAKLDAECRVARERFKP